MNILKKFSLIFIGIIISLVLLEFGLQITGFTLITIKKYQNKKTKDSNTITILCLGESTTDRQWPPILQKILDKKTTKYKFNVIDEGVVGTNTKKIASRIENYLIHYSPDIVISMMGINDKGLGYIQTKSKIINFIALIYIHILTHFFYTDASFFEIDSECFNLLKENKIQVMQQKYYTFFKKSKFKDKGAYRRLWEFANLYKNTKLYMHLLQLNDIPIDNETLKYIIQYMNNNNYTKDSITEFLTSNKSRIFFDYQSSPSLLEKTKFVKLLKEFVCDSSINEILHNPPNYNEHYISTNLLNSTNKTKNYIYILNSIKKFNKNITIYAMQYPILPIDELKNKLKYSPYYDKLIFISNENNFKQALKKYKTEDIFIDMFAGDFGHCTDLGNTLIAENVAENILKLYN